MSDIQIVSKPFSNSSIVTCTSSVQFTKLSKDDLLAIMFRASEIAVSSVNVSEAFDESNLNINRKAVTNNVSCWKQITITDPLSFHLNDLKQIEMIEFGLPVVNCNFIE